MSLLTPIGLLGLVGIIALIAIYIIKPNYQNKAISSTYVWRLSLKYRKQRIPISKINSLLLFIAQLLILAICGVLLAQPAIAAEKVGDENEKIIIIESSGSMQLTNGEKTRFERAIDGCRAMAEATFAEGGLVSVIIADSSPEFEAERYSSAQADKLYASFEALLSNDGEKSFGTADMEKAFMLAEEVLAYNNEARVYLYTATEYIEKNGTTVIDVAEKDEWNAAILGCDAKYNANNHYEITVDVGCFGKTEHLDIYCEVHGPNGASESIVVSRSEFFDPSEDTKTITLSTDDFGGTPLFDFDYIEAYVAVEDSLGDDNSFLLYGGRKETIRIQYASSVPNNFFSVVFRSLRDSMKDSWDIEFVEKKADEEGEISGFDLYIYEHRMPEIMPTDGVVLLVDPLNAPKDSGIVVGDPHRISSDSTLANGESHDLMYLVDPGRITIAKYNEIISADGYKELAYYKGNPVMLLKDTDEAKVIVWAFDLNYSNVIAMPDFSFLIYNLFDYFIPTTIGSHFFEIGDTVDISGRGTDLEVTGAGGFEESYEQGYGKITVTTPGTYTISQTLMRGDGKSTESFFVKIPASESDITKEVDLLPSVEVQRSRAVEYSDLLFYFAILLVALTYAEWYLHTKNNY